MRSIVFAAILFPSIASLAQEASVERPLESTQSQKISDSDFFEVTMSSEGTAEYWLKDKTTMQLPDQDIAYFGQKNFACDKPKAPYLVLAKYANGTGHFELQRSGTTLYIHHSSLGRHSVEQHTALVACLDFTPATVVSTISVAE